MKFPKPRQIELQDAKDAPDGTTLHRYTLELERRVSYREKGQIIVTTVTSPDRLIDRSEEIWNQVDDMEMLTEEDWSRDEDRHREVEIFHEVITKRCPYTAEMEF